MCIILIIFEAWGNGKQSTRFINIPHFPFYSLSLPVFFFFVTHFFDVAHFAFPLVIDLEIGKSM